MLHTCVKGTNKHNFTEQLSFDYICFVTCHLLGCDCEDGCESPKRTFIRLAAGPLLYPFNVFKALQAKNTQRN